MNDGSMQLIRTDVLSIYSAWQAMGFSRPFAIAVAGYPFTGKTFLSDFIAHASQFRRSAVLPTESVIAPRRDRMIAFQDGCEPASHHLDVLHDLVQALRAGKEVRYLNYSWMTGDHSGYSVAGPLGVGDVIIIDGSIAAHSSLAPLIDIAISLEPLDFQRWLRLAAERDVRERNWSRAEAVRQNLKKAETCKSFGVAQCKHLAYEVDPTSWQVVRRLQRGV